MDIRIEKLDNILSASEINCTDVQLEQLIKYYDMLIEKNKVMNLTAITEFDEFAVKHFSDCLSIKRIIDLQGESIIDVGTGAGFPGIPLKIVYPDIKLTLLDSLNKRLVFLSDVVEELQLKNVSIVHARAEEGARKKELREKYDIATARAVSRLSTLVEYCLPFVRVGGSFISYKASKAPEEIEEAQNAIKILGGQVKKTVDFKIGNEEMSRYLIQIDKIKSTSDKYPRAGGKPINSPL